jgi:hypothetical protein
LRAPDTSESEASHRHESRAFSGWKRGDEIRRRKHVTVHRPAHRDDAVHFIHRGAQLPLCRPY